MERAFESIDLNFDQIERICREYFKKGCLQRFQILSGGAINTTYKFVWDNRDYVLRLYVREPELVHVEKALYQLIHDKVPVPKLLHSGIIENFYPFTIFEFIDRKSVSEISPSFGSRLSYDLGKALARIHAFHFPKAGLFGNGLDISVPFETGSSPYFDYIMEHLTETSPAWSRLGSERAKKLRNFLLEHQDFFPTIQGGGALVHSDFKPVNLLWDEHEGLEILDWEFAHSGSPIIDFAILLRHFHDFPLNIEYLEKGYLEQGGVFPNNWIQKARISDTINIVQLLNRNADQPRLFKFLLSSVDFTLFRWSFLDEELRKASKNQ